MIHPEFKKQTENFIRKTLDTYKAERASPRIGRIWGCQNEGDFLCGFFVGEVSSHAVNAFQLSYKRAPTQEEYMEIIEIIESYRDEVIGFFNSLNWFSKN